MEIAQEKSEQERQPEPWLRGTLEERPPIERAVLHALELAEEDIARWCGGLSDLELEARPFGLPSVGFHLRHIAGSLDRFFTYADGRGLSEAQRAALAGELEPSESREAALIEVVRALESGRDRLAKLRGKPLETPLRIGRKSLPTTLGGLLVHMAEHTQRHAGQAITTAKVVMARREG